MNRSSAALAAVIVVLLVAGLAVLAQDAAQVAAPETTPAPGADAPTEPSIPPTDPAPAPGPDTPTERSIPPATDRAPGTGPDPASEGPPADPGPPVPPDAASDPSPGSDPGPGSDPDSDTGSDVALTTPDQGDDALPHTGGAPPGLGAALLAAALVAGVCRVGLRPLRDG